jgi:hypothetical protein
MSFNEVMALILPSVVALLCYLKLKNGKPSLVEVFCHLGLFILLTNCICYVILIYFIKTPVFLYTPLFTIKYSIISTCIALLIVILFRFLEMNMKIKLKVESVNEEEK